MDESFIVTKKRKNSDVTITVDGADEAEGMAAIVETLQKEGLAE